jgi:hypothetical protein
VKIQGHLAGGWLVTRKILKDKALSKAEYLKLLVVGTISGTLPDGDYFWYAYKKGGLEYKNDFRHHTWVTHTFPFYWLIASFIYMFGVFQKKQELKEMAKVFAVGTSVHLLQDAVGSGDGIMFLYPFSRKMSGIALLGLHGDEWEAEYVKRPIFLLERFIRVWGMATFLMDVIKRRI